MVRINLKSNELMWSGANNPIWIRRKNALEIEEIRPDKEPIGFSRIMTDYTNHCVDINKGDTFYLFSDGYADQFGGPKGKKFKAKAFKSMVLAIQDKSMEEQKVFITSSFDQWKGVLEQIDDVCVIGMRV